MVPCVVGCLSLCADRLLACCTLKTRCVDPVRTHLSCAFAQEFELGELFTDDKRRRDKVHDHHDIIWVKHNTATTLIRSVVVVSLIS